MDLICNIHRVLPPGSPYIWGSVISLHKSIRQTRFWEIAVISHEFLMPSDEIVLLMADRIDPRIEIINQFPQIHVSGDLSEHLNSAECILHYAGPDAKERNSVLLKRLFNSISANPGRLL